MSSGIHNPQDIYHAQNSIGGGGGSRTRVRNRCQPGVFMLCPVPFGFAWDAQNGQDAPQTSPIDLT